MILAIETSCDDTCVAVVTEDGRALSNVVSSQAAFHDRYGGVVPEVASRQHLLLANAVIEDALHRAGIGLDGVAKVAVTRGPGLIGALLVGLSAAKAVAASRGLPFVPVDHLHGHVAACFLEPEPFEPPFLCLIASGGHTLLAMVNDHRGFECLSQTRDDAAGEALDKGARLLGLSYPGGAELDKLAGEGDPQVFEFPAGMRGAPDFSFSGLKTALAYKVRDLGGEETQLRAADLAASYQRAVCTQLVEHLGNVMADLGMKRVALSGGVAANSELRRRVRDLADKHGAMLKVLPPELCTDNAAMIGSAARFLDPVIFPDYLAFDAFATSHHAAQ